MTNILNLSSILNGEKKWLILSKKGVEHVILSSILSCHAQARHLLPVFRMGARPGASVRGMTLILDKLCRPEIGYQRFSE